MRQSLAEASGEGEKRKEEERLLLVGLLELEKLTLKREVDDEAEDRSDERAE